MNLEIRRGRAKNRIRHVTQPVFLVGTNADCDLVLGDAQFGPIHFFLLSRDGMTTLRCLNDSPNVTVNGVEKRSGTLQDGDRIRTGPYEFLFKAA